MINSNFDNAMGGNRSRDRSPVAPRRKSIRDRATSPLRSGSGGGGRPTEIGHSLTMPSSHGDDQGHGRRPGIQRNSSFPAMSPRPPSAALHGVSNHDRRPPLRSGSARRASLKFASPQPVPEQSVLRQQRLNRQGLDRPRGAESPGGKKGPPPGRKMPSPSSPVNTKRPPSAPKVKGVNGGIATNSQRFGISRSRSNDSDLKAMSSIDGSESPSTKRSKLAQHKGLNRGKSAKNTNMSNHSSDALRRNFSDHDDTLTPKRTKKDKPKSRKGRTQPRRRSNSSSSSSSTGSGDENNNTGRAGRGRAAALSDDEDARRRLRRSPSALKRTLSNGSLRNGSTHSQTLRNSSHHERNAELRNSSHHERPGMGSRQQSIPWFIEGEDESIDSKEMVFHRPAKALVIVWLLVSAELFLDFITTAISLKAYKSEDLCCGELIDLGNLPLLIIVPFFTIILAELIVLLITIYMTVYRSKKEIHESQIEAQREQKRLEVLMGKKSALGQAAVKEAAKVAEQKKAIRWIVPKHGVIWYTTMNIFLLLNPFFGFLAAWLLLYQSSERQCFTVLAIEALATVLHWVSVHLEMKGRNEPYTQCTWFIHASPVFPLLSLVIVVFVYWFKGGVCYQVEQSRFWYDGCQICPDGTLPNDRNWCENDGVIGVQSGDYCGDGVDDSKRFCFFKYGN